MKGVAPAPEEVHVLRGAEWLPKSGTFYAAVVAYQNWQPTAGFGLRRLIEGGGGAGARLSREASLQALNDARPKRRESSSTTGRAGRVFDEHQVDVGALFVFQRTGRSLNLICPLAMQTDSPFSKPALLRPTSVLSSAAMPVVNRSKNDSLICICVDAGARKCNGRPRQSNKIRNVFFLHDAVSGFYSVQHAPVPASSSRGELPCIFHPPLTARFECV